MQIFNAFVGVWVADFAAARRVTEKVLAGTRRQGWVTSLAGVLPMLAICSLGEGRLAAAGTALDEGLEIARRLGFENDETGMLALKARIAAQRGREAECRELADTALGRALSVGLMWAIELARLALAELELGLGNARAALEHLDQLDPSPLPPFAVLAAPDVIDAALRLGEPDRGKAALRRLEAWAPVSDVPLVTGLTARCRAVLADDPDEAEARFGEALEAHADQASTYEWARTQLAYGEWLRRERRKTEARSHLRDAAAAFEGLGAALWAERAHAELNATGEKARKRDVSTLDDLTPQELRIAQLVGSGATNREVAAQLFVSPKTVEYHLRKVFLKVGVNSRVELARHPVCNEHEGPN
jgi:DNA-binding CsgD family transcriptional regulator